MSPLAAFVLGCVAGGSVFLVGFLIGVLLLSRGPDLVKPLLIVDPGPGPDLDANLTARWQG